MGDRMMRCARTMVSWILLVAMLVSLPGRAMGHFVCTAGMAEAGSTCPLCHGDATAADPGPRIGNNCCTFVAGQSVAESDLAPAQVVKPLLTQASQLLAVAGLGLLVAPDLDLSARADQRAAPQTPASGYLSNFLRL